MTNEERQGIRPPSTVREDTLRRASDVNTDPSGIKRGPAGSGDRDEAAIRVSREKLEQVAGWE